jgi:hypothetical protein
VNDRRGLSAIALLTLVACSSSQSQNPYLPPTGTGGTGGPIMTSGTVAVTLVTPSSPLDGGVAGPLATNSDVPVSATVDIVGGTDFIDPNSVKVALTATGSTVAVASGQLISTGSDLFAGTLSLGKLSAGSYTLTVTAASSGGAVGQATIGITVDDGPIVTVLSPAQGQSYNGTLTIELTADPGAYPPLTGPTVTVGGTVVPLAPDVAPNSYRATVAFDPPTPPPAGVQALPALAGAQLLDVKASNANGVTTDVQVIFNIDDTGPTITSTTPTPGQIVGGVLEISAKVTDVSGVLDSSVIAIIGDENTPLFELPLTASGGGVYSTLFDTGNLTACKAPPATSLCIVFPTISFRASDAVGNQTVIGYGFAVDNVAPVADLDPPEMRAMRLGIAGYECSLQFDPLSVNKDPGDMPDDGCMVPQVFDLRARIEDDGNRAAGLKVVPISTVDPDNTSVYILDDTSQPLVVDSDGDGNCDQINPLLVPTTDPPTANNQVLKIRLAGVPPAGSADYDFQSTNPAAAGDPPLPAGIGCIAGTAAAPPPVLCSFEQPTIAIGYSAGLPAIWSVEPIDSTFHCLGNQFDALANNISEGWACIAIGTADLAGNKSVSAPMRVYIKYDDAGGWCVAPPSGAGPPPTCTGTFDAGSNTATPGACQARNFADEPTIYCAPGAC